MLPSSPLLIVIYVHVSSVIYFQHHTSILSGRMHLCVLWLRVTEMAFIQEVNKEEKTSCFMLNHTLKVERCYDDDHIVVNSVFCKQRSSKAVAQDW